MKGRKVVPALESRTSLATHLRRDLETLGLKRVAKQVLTVEQILADHDNSNGSGNGKAEP